MMHTLIVNADEFGLTEDVVEAILRAHRAGVVTSTSALVTHALARDALERAHMEAPTLGLGLHLNVTEGTPVSPPETIPSLLDREGRFRPGPWWLSHPTPWRPAHLELELEAQMHRFRQWAGVEPDHIDAHQHMLLLHPAALAAYAALARRHDVPARSPGPLLTAQGLMRLVTRVKERYRLTLPPEAMEDRAADLKASWDLVRHPTDTLLDWTGEDPTEEGLIERLHQLRESGLPGPKIVEVVCHPGPSPSGAQETSVLTSDTVRGRLTQEGWTLGSFATSPMELDR